MTILSMNDSMPCGKYKGCKIKDLVENWHFLNSPQNYLAWAIKTWTNYKFSDDIIKAINKNQSELKKLQEEYKRKEFIRDKSEDTSKIHKKSDKNYEHYNDIGAITDISFQDIYGDFGY